MGNLKDKHPLYHTYEVPSSGGDTMGDIFRDAKAFFKERRKDNHTKALERQNEVAELCGAISIDDSNYTWTMKFKGKTLQYYPTRGKWQYMNKVYTGGIDSFIGWLKNQQGGN